MGAIAAIAICTVVGVVVIAVAAWAFRRGSSPSEYAFPETSEKDQGIAMSSAVLESAWSVDKVDTPGVPADLSISSEYFEETYSENQVKEQGNALGRKRQSSHIIWQAK